MIESSTRLGLETGVSRLSAGTVLQIIVGLSTESFQIHSCSVQSFSRQPGSSEQTRQTASNIKISTLYEQANIRSGQFLELNNLQSLAIGAILACHHWHYLGSMKVENQHEIMESQSPHSTLDLLSGYIFMRNFTFPVLPAFLFLSAIVCNHNKTSRSNSDK